MVRKGLHDLLFGPLVLAADLILLLRREIILDVESLADLVGRLALDHVGHSLAANIEKCLNVEVVGGLQGESQNASSEGSAVARRVRDDSPG